MARAFGTGSCMRLSVRTNVNLPQPDGPMIAVTVRSGKVRLMSSTALWPPKTALSPIVCIGAGPSVTGIAPGGGGVERTLGTCGEAVEPSDVIGPPRGVRAPRSGGRRC